MTASTVTTLGIIAAICLTIGYVVGWLISTLMAGQKKEKPKAVETEVKVAPAGTQRSLMRLMRDAEKGSLLIELAGKIVPAADKLSLDERKQLAGLLQEVSAWMGIPAVVSPAPVQTAQITPRQTGPLNPAVMGEPPVENPRPSMIDGVTNALADVLNPVSGTAAKKATLSIVEQIDEILQTKIANTPLEAMKIYMIEDARKNVVVWVGNSAYEGIGAMPEGEIKELIKSCVQEWERRQEKNLRRVGSS